MGQTPKPMRVYVTERSMLEWEYFRELRAKGNLVKAVSLKPNTLLMGPGCHRLLLGMESYAEEAVKSARKVYVPVVSPKKKKKGKQVKAVCDHCGSIYKMEDKK